MAMMSVPPEDAFTWNRIAEPNAGRPTANINSSTGWLVMGAFMGMKRSKA